MNTKKIIIIGTLSAILVGLCSFAYTKFKPRTTTPVIKPAYADEVETANGNWYFNETLTNQTPTGANVNTLSPSQTETYSLNYTTINNTSYTIMQWRTDTNTHTYGQFVYRASSAQVSYNFNTNTWTNEDRKTIKITGGTDTTNPLFIQWLKQNATKLPNSIENTSWKINNTITANAGYGQFSINFYSNGYKYNNLKIGYHADSIDNPTTKSNAFMFNNSYNVYDNGTWEHERQWSRITITDGTDTTNLSLILWLYNNAEQMNFISSVINTKWTFEDSINTIAISDNIYNIQFTTNRKQSFYMRVGRSTNTIDYAIKTPNQATTPYVVQVVYNTYWTNPNYKTIIITGTEVIQQSGVQDVFLIISFLQSNANGTSYTPIPTNPDDYDIEDGNFTSIQSLILRILTLPFTFLAQAFDVTLWEGTAWEFNISNFIMAIIAIAAILFIIKLFTSEFSVLGNYSSNRAETKLTKSKTKLNKQQYKQNKQQSKQTSKKE